MKKENEFGQPKEKALKLQRNSANILVEIKRYHANATGKDKVIYDEIVKSLLAGTSVMDIHRRMDVAIGGIYSIKR